MKKAKSDAQNQAKQKRTGFLESLNTTLKSKPTADFEQHLVQTEKQKREKDYQFFERKRVEEKTIWTAQEQETALQIKTVQAELKRLVQEIKNLNKDIKVAATQTIVEPGIYHLGFFERLGKLLVLIRKKVQESQHWLTEWNSYCKRKKNFYWSQVQKSGTKFMLSSERYMSTQAG